MRKYMNKLYWQKLYCKVVKHGGTPESVALGLGIGVFCGFLIPTGGQILVALGLAFLLKANKVPAVLGTMVTNPYTATFFVPIQCWIGGYVIGDPLSLSTINANLSAFFADISWESLWSLGGELIISLLVGGAVFAVVFSIPAYYLSLWTVRAYRRRREERFLQRQSQQPARKSTVN